MLQELKKDYNQLLERFKKATSYFEKNPEEKNNKKLKEEFNKIVDQMEVIGDAIAKETDITKEELENGFNLEKDEEELEL